MTWPEAREAASLAITLSSELAEYGTASRSRGTEGSASPTLRQDGHVTAYDQRVHDHALRAATRSRFLSEHYSDAVEAGVKVLNETVRSRSGSNDDGDSLMGTVFSPKDPILRINAGRSKSDQSEQRGYMNLCMGVVGGWRNPRAHNSQVMDTPEEALMMLEVLDHLISVARKATRTRRRKRT